MMSEKWGCTTDPRWLLAEEGFNLAREHEVESLFAISNGKAGSRGSLEEGSPLSAPATFVAGIFHHPARPGAVPELLTFPNWLGSKIWVNGSPLTMQEGEVLEHRRILDLKQATLWREWRQRDPHGRITRFESSRLASLADRRLLLQRVILTAENYCLSLQIESSIELGPGIRALLPLTWKSLTNGECPNLLSLGLVLPNSQVKVAFCIATQMIVPSGMIPERQIGMDHRHIVERFRLQAGAGASCEIQRFVSVLTLSDDQNPLEAACSHSTTSVSAGIWSAVSAHQSEWRARWQAADVQIEGDDSLQQSLRFAIYHLISAANPEDCRISVGARALTGDSYKGHVFWDSEIYMLPFYTSSDPVSARALLSYRYHTLPAAREKARAAGYKGAMYAWESADTGEEVTPALVITPGGEVLSVSNGEMEIHITADIAYAIWQYWDATDDDAFFLDCGAEIILESARFWASRGSLESDGVYHIRHVIGPDEYHEDVDDNAFTNLMAAWNLRCGTRVVDLLKVRWMDDWHRLAERIQLTESEVSLWPKLAAAMATGFNPTTLLYEQFAGYFEKDEIDLNTFEPRFTAVDVILGHKQVQQTNIVKQADVVMAIYLLWDQFPPEVREANFRYYEPRTAHGSSLSPSIHASVAARLGDMDLARKYTKQSAEIDLGNIMGNAAGGVHAAALGGLWQTVVFGFAGLQAIPGGVMLSPKLLPHWSGLSFPYRWRDHLLKLSIKPESVQVRAIGHDSIKVRLAAGPELIASPDQTYITTREQHGWGMWRTLD